MYIDILHVGLLCSHNIIVSDEWRAFANIHRIHIGIYEHNYVVRNVVVVVLLSQRWSVVRNEDFFNSFLACQADNYI